MANILLHLHSSSEQRDAPQVSCQYQWNLQKNSLELEFKVAHCSAPVYNEKFLHSPHNWGLWEWDVVETFLQLRENESDIHAPYLEIQVSPLNQRLALLITKPREKFYSILKYDFKSQVFLEDGLWRTQIEVLLPRDHLGKGKRLYGNFFACLGEQQKRRFFAQTVNQDKEPNFHIPENFSEIIEQEQTY